MSEPTEFLLVTDDSWVEVPDAYNQFQTVGYVLATIQELIQSSDWIPLSQALEDIGAITPNTLITNARVINTEAGETSYRFWFIQ